MFRSVSAQKLMVPLLGAVLAAGAKADMLRVPTEYPTIQVAITAAQTGDTVLVEDGTYVGPGNKDLDFGGKVITVRSENGRDNCVIDCQNVGRGFFFQNHEAADSIVEGFTIINGNEECGGAIFCYQSSPTIRDCAFDANVATEWVWSGGAICCHYDSSPLISNCSFTNNQGIFGGAIYCSGGSSPTMLGCTFTENQAENNGGAIHCTAGCNPTIRNCTISRNYARDDGGGIYCTDQSHAEITNCVIVENSTGESGSGGGIACVDDCDATITNCTIIANTAQPGAYDSYGGAVLCAYDCDLVVVNCVLWGDTAEHGPEIALMSGGGSAATLTVAYSNVEGGADAVYLDDADCTLDWADGNLDPPADPACVDPAGGDYRLWLNSPCIDAADNAAVPAEVVTDPDGKPRIVDGDTDGTATVDMGAYEFHTIYVCWDGSGDFTTIQDGIDAAPDEFEVVVCDGTYAAALDKNLDFGGKAISVRSENGPANCTIDCRGDGRGFHFHSGETAASVVSGFTITNGMQTGSPPGGAIFCYQSSPTIRDCAIVANSVSSFGGGIACVMYSHPTIINCAISDNYAYGDGGGICCLEYSSPAITNCTITNNQAGLGGGIGILNFSEPVITNCTTSQNLATEGGGVGSANNSYPTITNCILWGDAPEEIAIHGPGGEADVTYCDVEGGWGDPDNHNLAVDPQFVDPAGGDYHLSSTSLCIDAANDTAVPLDLADLDCDGDTGERTPLDLDGNPRFADPPPPGGIGSPAPPGYPEIVDMGAYEFDQCFGDLDGDGDIDLADLAALLANYGMTGGAEYADGDLDSDGDVDLADLAGLLSVYGAGCP